MIDQSSLIASLILMPMTDGLMLFGDHRPFRAFALLADQPLCAVKDGRIPRGPLAIIGEPDVEGRLDSEARVTQRAIGRS
jgi:hypothetical protein